MGGKGYKSYTSLTGKKVSGDWEDSDRGAGNKSKRRAGGEVEAKSPTYIAHVINKGKKKVDPKKNPAVKESVRITDAKGRDFLEIIDIIKPEPMKSPKNTVQWNEEKIAKLMKKANEKKRKNALQINKIVGTQ